MSNDAFVSVPSIEQYLVDTNKTFRKGQQNKISTLQGSCMIHSLEIVL